jgi:TonB family protein
VKVAIATVLLLCATAFAQEHKVGVSHFVPPQYSPISRQANVSGEVVLELKLRPDGEVKDIKVVSGHPLLKQPAIDTLKQWRFVCTDCAIGEPFEQKVTLAYKLRGESECSPDSNVRYEYRFPEYASVETAPVAICDPAGIVTRRSGLLRLLHVGRR